MFELHDCTKCSKTGTCPIYPIAPWINEHMAEIETAFKEEGQSMVKLYKMCSVNLAQATTPIEQAAAFKLAFLYAFMIGYHRRDTKTEIPKIFEP